MRRKPEEDRQFTWDFFDSKHSLNLKKTPESDRIK